MTAEWIRHQGWILVCLWVVAYVADYALTLVGARLYQTGVNQHFVLERGYELNPVFQKDVADLRRLSPRFLVLLTISTVYLIGFWFLVGRPRDGSPGAYEFVTGLLLLMEVVVCGRHLVNIYTFRFVRRSDGVRGRVEFSHWLSLEQTVAALVASAVPFGIWAVIDESWFAAGGTVGCLALGARLFLLARRARDAPNGAS